MTQAHAHDALLPLTLAYPGAPLACAVAANADGVSELFETQTESVDRLADRRRADAPGARAALDAVAAFNREISAHATAQRNAERLAAGDALCVMSGQQVGFLGGPAYTAYKIVSTLRLAGSWTKRLGIHVVPVFWMATQDHDLGEISRCHAIRRDGEIGAYRFDWPEAGRPIAALPRTPEVRAAHAEYLNEGVDPAHRELIEEWTAAEAGDDYCLWHARILARLFSSRGLVLVDPSLLDDAARPLYERFCRLHEPIRAAVADGAAAVSARGFDPVLPAERAGRLFVTEDRGTGPRRRLTAADRDACERIHDGSWRASPDAALRPLTADSLFPVIANILGPGELSYHAQLLPLYRLLDVPQPVPVLRLSCTVASPEEHRLATAADATPELLVGGRFDVPRAALALAPDDVRVAFDRTQGELDRAFADLGATVTDADPSLAEALSRARGSAEHAVQRLRDRVVRARLARDGHSLRELQRLRNAIRPRDRLQERVLPWIHFAARHGPSLVDRLIEVDGREAVGHHWVIAEAIHGSM